VEVEDFVQLFNIDFLNLFEKSYFSCFFLRNFESKKMKKIDIDFKKCFFKYMVRYMSGVNVEKKTVWITKNPKEVIILKIHMQT